MSTVHNSANGKPRTRVLNAPQSHNGCFTCKFVDNPLISWPPTHCGLGIAESDVIRDDRYAIDAPRPGEYVQVIGTRSELSNRRLKPSPYSLHYLEDHGMEQKAPGLSA